MPPGSLGSLETCEGLHLGINAMTQALVGEVQGLGELTIQAMEGKATAADAAAKWTEWQLAASMVYVMSKDLLLDFPDHPAKTLIEVLDESYLTTIYSAAVIGGTGFDPATGDVDEFTLDTFGSTFLDAAADLRATADRIFRPLTVDLACS